MLKERMEALDVEGLTSLSAWHNGKQWVAAVAFHHGLTDVGYGETSATAILAAFAESEENRHKTPRERYPEDAERFDKLAAYQGRKAGTEELDFDGY